MAKKVDEEIKPIASGYDFGDEWLDDLEEALVFDANDATNAESEKNSETVPVESSENADGMDLISVVDDGDSSLMDDLELMAEVDGFDDVDIDVSAELGNAESGISDGLNYDELHAGFEIDLGLNSDSDMAQVSDDENAITLDNPVVSDFMPDEADVGEPVNNLDVSVEDVELEEEPVKSAGAGSAAGTESAAQTANSENRGAVVAQMLNIVALQRQAEKHARVVQEDHGDDNPLSDPQLWQFVSLIAMRLFDDLELLIVQKQNEEACDLMKQLNRLANILSFAGLGEQLPLIAYIGNLLPLSFSDVEIGQESQRSFDPMKMRHFLEKSNEFLNCLVYLLTYLSKRAVGFDTARFTDALERLYTVLELVPGEPSPEAPLAITDNVNPHELTTRTVSKLSRTLEALVTESLHYIESGVFYGYASGYGDAVKSLNNASQIAREYRLHDLENVFNRLYSMLRDLKLPRIPETEFFDGYSEVCNMLEKHFDGIISEKKLKHLRALIIKFGASDSTQNTEPFSTRWATFIRNASPILELENVNMAGLRRRVRQLSGYACESSIRWLCETFEQLDTRWDVYSESCSEAFIMLADELRAFPTEDIDEADIEQLNHERLKVLFARKPDARPQSSYAIIKGALQLSDILIQQFETPHLISSVKIQELLIDARLIHCHAITRICQILLSLLERIPRQSAGVPECAESVVNAICFTAGFMQTVCRRLLLHLEHEQNTPAVSSEQIFYSVLLSLYQTPGQPRDGVTWFIVKRLNSILSELQLVWVNTSTPTSTEYYCSLLRRLLHLATICEMNDVRGMLVAHMDDIPTADFINTENQTMNRQCHRIIRAIEDSCPKLSVLPSSQQVHSFFARSIAALNQLLTSSDSATPESLGSEISRIESRMSLLGMTTDFPPVIAFIFELHHLAYHANLDRRKVEDLLYQMINVANNVCPEWVQPKDADLEFVKTSVPVPMPIFQDIMESLGIVYEAFKPYAQDEPSAWERLSSVYRCVREMVTYVPSALHSIVINSQNRCRYLKKNIYIEIDTSGYPKESDLPVDSIRSVIGVAFTTIVGRIVETIVDNAFSATDYSSRISIVLHPFANEYAVSVIHNGKLFTLTEMLEKLEKINIMPADDDNIFDLLVGAPQLMLSYPPVNDLAYILPILRQFDGRLDVSLDNERNTKIDVSFKL